MTEGQERLYLDDLAVGQRFASGGVAGTVRERREQGAADCRDRSSRPRRPSWKVSGGGACRGMRPAPRERPPARRPLARGPTLPCRT